MPALVVKGYNRIMRGLDDIQEGLRKDTMREISRAAGDVRKKARGYVPMYSPMSGWDKSHYKSQTFWSERAYDYSTMVRGIRVKRGQSRPDRSGFRNVVGVENASAPGVIFELAGTKSNGRNPQGPSFIAGMEIMGLRRPLRRLVFRAMLEMQAQTNARIGAALDRAGVKFNLS